MRSLPRRRSVRTRKHERPESLSRCRAAVPQHQCERCNDQNSINAIVVSLTVQSTTNDTYRHTFFIVSLSAEGSTDGSCEAGEKVMPLGDERTQPPAEEVMQGGSWRLNRTYSRRHQQCRIR